LHETIITNGNGYPFFRICFQDSSPFPPKNIYVFTCLLAWLGFGAGWLKRLDGRTVAFMSLLPTSSVTPHIHHGWEVLYLPEFRDELFESGHNL
jgi:hypothetical protein